MKSGGAVIKRPPSLIWYLVAYIALIIGIVVAATLAVSYYSAKEAIGYDYAVLQEYADSNAIESVWLVNKGLELIDENLNPLMAESLDRFRVEYIKSGSDPARMNLSALRSEIAPAFSGDVNLYIFDADGIIRYTTLPEVLGVDFRQYPDFYASLTRIRLGSDFAADPVVRSVQNASDPDVKGTLRKFAYLPTPDHRYVLEIGVESSEFSDVRSQYSYQQMANRLLAVNPDMTGIRVYDFYDNVAAQAGNFGNDGWQYAEMTRLNRSSLSIWDPAKSTLTRFLFVDLHDPGAASDNSVVLELQYSSSRLDAALSRLVAQYLLIGLCAAVMGILLAYALFRKITGQIGAIVSDVEQIAGGDLDHTIRSVNTLEFAHLEAGINTMIKKILAYTEELEHKKAELQVAADIQQAFLPKAIASPAGFDLAAASVPAREVGGDFYDVFAEGDGRIALVIADVAGKGVPASLFMALSRTAVRIVSRWATSARQVVSSSNAIFIEDSGSTSFVTLFYGLLDEKRRILSYVNAGHNPPLLLRAGGSLEDLPPTGPVIGLSDDPVYEEQSIALAQGDVLVMYTDGVTEAFNNEGEMFSDDRLRRVIAECHALPAARIVETIRSSVTAFCGTAPQADDMTILVLRVL